MIGNKITKQNNWLNDYSKNVYSQEGEDGIIEKILEILPDKNSWSVEFGAWDGMHLSNTYNLIKNKGYSAVLIEGCKKKFRILQKNFEGNGKIIPINAFVGFEDKNGLDSILKTTKIPVYFDVLSIDIDGNDYHIWDAFKHYRPKIVIIEYNPTIANQVEFINPKDMSVMYGSSILSIDKLARQKDYMLIANTRLNAIFVDKKYFDLFEIENNSVNAIRTEQLDVSYIFNGYDGTVFVRGCGKMHWHHIPYKASRLQQVPKLLRDYPGNYGLIKKVIAKLYRYLRK